jgi:5-carboxymethyl-2-hydroxymuconate isomerase
VRTRQLAEDIIQLGIAAARKLCQERWQIADSTVDTYVHAAWKIIKANNDIPVAEAKAQLIARLEAMLQTATPAVRISVLKELAKLHGAYAPVAVANYNLNVDAAQLPCHVQQLLSDPNARTRQLALDEQYLDVESRVVSEVRETAALPAPEAQALSVLPPDAERPKGV